MAEHKIDITILSGISAGDVFHFTCDEPRPVRVGRSPDNDLVLDDPAVSRKHAEILHKNGNYLLSDVGSSSGTFHMGFKLPHGAEGASKLSDGDEFKIGEAIFRVNFEDRLNGAASNVEKDKAASYMPSKKWQTQLKRYRFHIGAAVIGLIGIIVLLMPEKKPSGLPQQRSQEVLTIPQERVIGFFVEGQAATQRDRSHLDKAQFLLPASDVLIEFEYISETPVEILIDQAKIRQLDPSGNAWQRWQLIIRDPAIGAERKLIFNNLSWPKPNTAQANIKRWAVRNVRMIPLSIGITDNYDSKLNELVNTVTRIPSRQEGLYSAIRGLQMTIIYFLHSHSLEAVAFPVQMEADMPSIIEMRERIDGIISERSERFGEYDSSMQNKHLASLISLTGQLDAELWRRVMSLLSQARLAGNTKDFIVAHDHLLSAKRMFEDELDMRWQFAERMFNNDRVVSSKVRLDPDRHRDRRFGR